MRSKLLWALAAILLAGCQLGAPTQATPAATPEVVAATSTVPPAPPTPTSLAEGLVTRLATPNPSPNCPDHYPWFFENRASECATTVLNTWAVLQRFERGLMVWFQEGGRTLIFIDDGSPFKPYQEVSDPANTELPGPDPSIVPPGGLYQPELGFAKFWRGLVPGTDWIRPQLGWALAPETGYSALWQCNAAGDRAARCYFTGPRDEIIAVTNLGAQFWTYWQGPVR